MTRMNVAALAAAPRALACRVQPDARLRSATAFVAGFGASVGVFAVVVGRLIGAA